MENLELLLHSAQNIRTVNTDAFQKIEILNKNSLIHEYDVKNVISASEIFNIEREENEVYRIYGRLEYLSLLNGIKSNYFNLSDFFNPTFDYNSKSIFNSFDFYLIRPYTGYTNIVKDNNHNIYIRYFQIIATPNEFELIPAGYSNNVYEEQIYCFVFNKDFDVSTYYDDFKFPATELFLYAQYKKQNTPNEILSFIDWDLNGNEIITQFNPINLNIGDALKTINGKKIGDLIEYSKPLFLQKDYIPQTYYITTPYSVGKRLIWKYNPFIPLRLRYFTDQIYYGNISGSSYEQVESIPIYATEYPENSGNYVWRKILQQGYIDPIKQIGVDYPFVNKKRYLFANIILDVIPDLNDNQTYDVFREAQYGQYGIIKTSPIINDVNDISKPCL